MFFNNVIWDALVRTKEHRIILGNFDYLFNTYLPATPQDHFYYAADADGCSYLFSSFPDIDLKEENFHFETLCSSYDLPSINKKNGKRNTCSYLGRTYLQSKDEWLHSVQVVTRKQLEEMYQKIKNAENIRK